MKRHVLVTGAHRSGTTWLARMLAFARGTVPLALEPFNPGPGQYALGGLAPYFYMYVPGIEQEAALTIYRRILEGREKRLFGWRQVHRWNPFPTRGRVVVKDPPAALSSEWLAGNFDLGVLVLVRHPAGFASSLKRLGWVFDWDNLLRQEALMRDQLEPFRSEIEARPQGIVEQAAVLWRCVYHVLLTYAGRNPGWIVRTHEELAVNPLREIRELYRILGLEWTARVERRVRGHTNARNPAAAPEGVVHQLRRDSAAAVRTWRKILTEEEVSYLRRSTGEMAARFYSDEEW